MRGKVWPTPMAMTENMVNYMKKQRAELDYEEDGEPRHGEKLTQNPWPGKENAMDADTVQALFRHLSTRQKHALTLYYGIGGSDGHTLEEAGKKLMIRSMAWFALLACRVDRHRCPVSAKATA